MTISNAFNLSQQITNMEENVFSKFLSPKIIDPQSLKKKLEQMSTELKKVDEQFCFDEDSAYKPG